MCLALSYAAIRHVSKACHNYIQPHTQPAQWCIEKHFAIEAKVRRRSDVTIAKRTHSHAPHTHPLLWLWLVPVDLFGVWVGRRHGTAGQFGLGGELVDNEQTVATQLDNAPTAGQLQRRNRLAALTEYRFPRVSTTPQPQPTRSTLD